MNAKILQNTFDMVFFFIANNLRTFNVILWIYSLKTYRYEKEVMQFDMD